MSPKKAVIYFFVLSSAVLSLLEINCGDTVTNPPADNYWSGTIPGWTLGERSIEGQVVTSQYNFIAGRGSINPQGDFSIRFTTPPDSLLSLFTSIPPICHNNLIINPPGTKYAAVILYVMGDSTQLGQIRKSNSDTIRAGMYEISTVYVTGNVTLGGSVTCYTDTAFYNWSASAGWNAPVVYYSRISGSGNTVRVSNNEPPGLLSWRFRRY